MHVDQMFLMRGL